VIFFFTLESLFIEVSIVSLSNDILIICYPIHRENDRILYSPVIHQGEL
jgi:hypothetical protein